LWLLSLVGLTVFAFPLRKLVTGAAATLLLWSQRQARARADAQLWALAKADPRVMADLDAAYAHAELESQQDSI
jgi:hypothetical protein